MSGQNEFAERLKRIEARQGGRPERPVDSLPPLEAPGGGDGGPGGGSGFGPARIALILLVILAMLGAGGLYVVNTFGKQPGKAVASSSDEARTPVAAASAAPASIDIPPVLALEIKRPVVDSEAPPAVLGDNGWTLAPGVVANADRAEVTLEQVVSGYDPSRPDTVPGNVEMFDPNGECKLRRPAPGEVVHNVRLGSGTGLTDLHVVSDTVIAEALMEHLQGVLTVDKSYKIGKTANARMSRVDVFVTDTSGPVYLVLQSLYGNVLWNVHRGPGVQIAHVALIGSTPGVILPGEIGFEALRVSDFVEDHEFGANDEIRPCMIRPWRKPEPHWPAQRMADDGNQLYVNQIHSFSTGFRAFNTWYTGMLGVDADSNLVAAEGAAHVLVGPVPAGPLGYNRIEGRTVNLVRTDRVYRGDDALLEAHLALLTAAVGGDPRAVDPAPMERAQR